MRGSLFPAADHGRVVWAFNPVISQRQWLFCAGSSACEDSGAAECVRVRTPHKGAFVHRLAKKNNKRWSERRVHVRKQSPKVNVGRQRLLCIKACVQICPLQQQGYKGNGSIRKKSVRCPKLAHRDFVAACDGNKKSATHWDQWYVCDKSKNFSHEKLEFSSF